MIEWGSVASWITLGLVASTAIIIPLVKYFWRKRFPFRMDFSKEDFKYEDGRHYKKIQITNKGQHEIYVRIRPLTGLDFQDIDIRFITLNRKAIWLWLWYEAVNASSEAISITNVEPNGLDQFTKLEKTYLDKGIYQGKYVPPYHRDHEDSIWLIVQYEAKQEWSGLLSFRSGFEGHRRYARRKVIIKAD